MKESASIVLWHKDIEDILFKYYLGDSHPKIKKQIEETGKMYCNIKTKKGLLNDKRYIDFTLMYEIINESLGKVITKQITVSLTELWNIINETIAYQGYEIDYIEDNLIYGFDENTKPGLNFITFHLKKQENVKTKKKGLKKNV
jgi:hypothetical protein